MYNVPKMGAYAKSLNEAKHMSFLIKDDELQMKENKICDKLSNNMKKEFDSKPLYNKKFLQNKIKTL